MVSISRVALAAAAAVAVVAVWGAPAVAHVTVGSTQATPGGFAKVTFRVPNESTDTDTTKVEISLPADAPLASVSVKPVPGWTAEITKAPLVTPLKSENGEVTESASRVSWTATGAATAIKPGEFQEFDVSMGPLPAKSSLVFKALQTYSDGQVVRWIDEPKAGTSAEHPAPVLALTTAAAPPTTPKSPGTALSYAAVILALSALALGVITLLRGNRRTAG